jgi:hypothetical protein
MYFSVSHPRLYPAANSRYFSASFENGTGFLTSQVEMASGDITQPRFQDFPRQLRLTEPD